MDTDGWMDGWMDRWTPPYDVFVDLLATFTTAIKDGRVMS